MSKSIVAQPAVPVRYSSQDLSKLATAGYYNYSLLHKAHRGQGDGLLLLQHIVQSFESLHKLQGDYLLEDEKPE